MCPSYSFVVEREEEGEAILKNHVKYNNKQKKVALKENTFHLSENVIKIINKKRRNVFIHPYIY